jgi:creatinine amidohydrolase
VNGLRLNWDRRGAALSPIRGERLKLQLATWPEVVSYLERSQGIVIPIGSTEQHGPTGLIGTDAICPETIAAGLAEEGILVAPTLSIGMAQHHLAFPGSITLRPSTLMAVIRDVVGSLAGQGFRQFYFYNGHGGNIATVNAAFAEIWADASLAGRASGLNLKLANWFAGPRVKALGQELYGEAEGSHATPSEISLTWHAWPEAERHVDLQPARAVNGPIRDARHYRQTFADGRIGSEPALASREHGARFYQAALADALEDYRQFLRG